MAKRNGGIIGPSNVPTGQYGGTAPGVWRLRDAFNYIKAGLWPAIGNYPVGNSARFNSGSSDYLTRTPASATNQKTFTISFWVKRSTLGNMYIGGTGSAAADLSVWFQFNSSDYFRFGDYNSSVGFNMQFITTQVFRDVSAWYHIVIAIDTTQATSTNRVKLYVNGSQVTDFGTSTYPTQNQNLYWNNADVHSIGRTGLYASTYFNGYLSDIYSIDGQQLTPSSFGQTDSATGIWTPKPYYGTYGTNGFYLKFANSASLGTDSSGNGNTFTVNNLTSVDQSTDTPTNNFATMNALNNLSFSGSGTLTEGNLQVSYSGGLFQTNATMAVNTGKWFWETKGVSNMQQGTVGARIGFLVQDNTGYTNQYFEGGCIFGMWWHPTVGIYTNVGATQTLRSSTLTYTNGDIIGIALDLTNNISYWYKNGTLSFTYDFSALITIGSYFMCASLGNGSGSASPVFQCNFGSPMYSANSYTDGAGYGNFSYAVPSGYYSLNTKNLANFG
jgi:hypothetical protein